MESGNSSSMQSSSGGGGGGGEEEFDSRAAADQSISAFFDHHVSSQQNHINLLHLDHNNNNSLLSPNYFNNNNNIFLPVNQQPDPVSQPDPRALPATSSLPPPNNIGGVIKKTKKRSRASRRAPTTVLTTDTSNFRAMVQEFTGIPSPPLFNNNSVVNTTRLNAFLGLSSTSSPNTFNNNSLLLRPFAQKLLPTTSPLLSGSHIQQYQNPNNSFENMNLQSLLQAQVSNVTSNPRSNEHDHFGHGMLQSSSTTPTTMAANGNITTGENGCYGGSDHDNDGTWLCSSSGQRT